MSALCLYPKKKSSLPDINECYPFMTQHWACVYFCLIKVTFDECIDVCISKSG